MTKGSQFRIYGRIFVVGSWSFVVGYWAVTLAGQALILSGEPASVSGMKEATVQSLHLIFIRMLLGVYGVGIVSIGVGIGLAVIGFILVHQTGR
ncbi:MAG: hypothetical protein ABEJ48_03650 [Halobacteriales archaeon]